MWFRIEVEHNLFAGISLFDTEAIPKDGNLKGYQVHDITAEIIDEAARSLNRDIITPADWWFAWCYPNGKRQDDYYDDVPDFKHMNQCAKLKVYAQKNKKVINGLNRNSQLGNDETLLYTIDYFTPHKNSYTSSSQLKVTDKSFICYNEKNCFRISKKNIITIKKKNHRL